MEEFKTTINISNSYSLNIIQSGHAPSPVMTWVSMNENQNYFRENGKKQIEIQASLMYLEILKDLMKEGKLLGWEVSNSLTLLNARQSSTTKSKPSIITFCNPSMF